MKVSKCRKFWDLMLKTVAALVNVLKNENLTENVSKFCVGRALMPVQSRSHGNYHTFSFRISGYFLFLKTSLSQFSILNPQIFGTY